MIWPVLAAFSNVHMRERSLYSGRVCWMCSSSPWHLTVNLFPKDSFEQDLPQSNRRQDLICHIQNDSFFTSSSRKGGEIKRVGKLFCSSQQPLSSKSELPQRGKRWPTEGHDKCCLATPHHWWEALGRLSITERLRWRVRQWHAGTLAAVWPCWKWHRWCPGNWQRCWPKVFSLGWERNCRA